MSYNYLAQARRPATFFKGEQDMAGIQAGVVGEAQLYSQPSQPSKMSASLGSPGTWSWIIVATAFVYLVGVYMGAIRIAGRSE